MDSLTMLTAAAWLLGISAAGGLLMAVLRFSGAWPRPPDALAMLHGLLAAAGLTLMIYAAIVAGVPGLALGAIALFVLAALGGLVLNLMFHQKQVELPKPLVLGHGALAVVAYLMLLMSLRSPVV
jgi:hypothetical protein